MHANGELFCWYFDPHSINHLITMATNEEMLVSAFHEKIAIIF